MLSLSKDQVHQKVSKKFHEWFVSSPKIGTKGHYCLQWSMFLIDELWGLKIPAQPQAGSAFWQMVSKDHDDLVSDNSYGFEFELTPITIAHILQGEMPEMHCWVAICWQHKPFELVDFTAPFFKQRAIDDGYTWLAPDPPSYLWTENFTEIEGQCRYSPDRQAIALTWKFIQILLETQGEWFPNIVKMIEKLDPDVLSAYDKFTDNL